MASQKESKQVGRPRVDGIRQYFVFNSEDGYSHCQIQSCNAKIKGDHHGNLQKHIKSCHSLTHPQENRQSTSAPSKMTAKEIKSACIEMVVMNGQPLSLMDDSGFQRILTAAFKAANIKNCTISSASIRDIISAEANKIRASISKEIQGKIISLKVDIISHLNRSFLGINIQFVDNSLIHVKTLGIIELKKTNSVEYVKSIIEGVLKEYHIDIYSIYSFTSDTAWNLAELQKLPEEKQDESSSEGNDSDQGDHQSKQPKEQNTEPIDENPFLTASGTCCLSSEGTQISNVQCISNSLQLAVVDALKSIENTEDIVAKAQRVAKALNSSTIKRLLLSSRPNAQTPEINITCWTFTVEMLESLLKLKDFCQELASTHETLHLSEEEWQFISDYVTSLRPARRSILRLRKQNLTLGSFYSIWLGCKFETLEIPTKLAEKLVSIMIQREERLMENKALLAAIYLDPRFFVLLSQKQRDDAIVELKAVWKKIQEHGERSNEFRLKSEDEDDQSPQSSTNKILREELRRLWALRDAESMESLHNLLVEFPDSIKREDPAINVLLYWEEKQHQMLRLYKLAKVVNGVLASQTTLEQLASEMKFILFTMKEDVTSTILNDIMVLRCSSQNMSSQEDANAFKRRRISSDS